MLQTHWKKSAMMLALISPLLVGACATPDSVSRAQATADQANQKADKNTADIAALNAKLDRMFQGQLKK